MEPRKARGPPERAGQDRSWCGGRGASSLHCEGSKPVYPYIQPCTPVCALNQPKPESRPAGLGHHTAAAAATRRWLVGLIWFSFLGFGMLGFLEWVPYILYGCKYAIIQQAPGTPIRTFLSLKSPTTPQLS